MSPAPAMKAAPSLAGASIKFGQLIGMLLLVSMGCSWPSLVEMRPFDGSQPVPVAFGGMIQQQPTSPLLLRLNRQTVAAELKQQQQQQPKKQKSFESDCLRAHNKWRRLHQAPELVFDKKIAAFAQKRANFIADSDGAEFRHPPDLPFGENLAWHSRATKSCAELIKMWYDEVDLYDFKRAAFSHETGHFTQLVWRETRHVGCASAISSGPRGGIYLVCNYDPPGNFLGEGHQNVLRRATTQDPPVPTTSTTTTSTTSTTTVAPPTTQQTTTSTAAAATAATNNLVGSNTSRSLDTTTTVAPVGAGESITSKKPANGNGRRKSKGKKKKGNKKKNNKNKNNKKKKGNKNKNKRRNNSNTNNNNNKKLKLEAAAAATSTSIPIVTSGSTAIPLLAVQPPIAVAQ